MHVADDGDICSIFAGLAGLEALSLHCGWGSNIHMQLDIRSITGLLQKCPNLRELDIAFSASTIPPLPSTSTTYGLRKITNHSSSSIANTIDLARHLDRLFPCLNTVRCDRFVGGDEAHAAWAQVQELVFAFQDVRREASRNAVAKV
jgi:hypothetical protein